MKNVRIRLLGFSVHQTEIICISTVNSIWLHLLLQNYKIASSIGKSVHHAQRCTERTPGNLLFPTSVPYYISEVTSSNSSLKLFLKNVDY